MVPEKYFADQATVLDATCCPQHCGLAVPNNRSLQQSGLLTLNCNKPTEAANKALSETVATSTVTASMHAVLCLCKTTQIPPRQHA
jgi:hypothetical protein